MNLGNDRNGHGRSLLGDEHSGKDDIELSELDNERQLETNYKLSSDSSERGISTLWISAIIIITVLGFTVNTEATVYFEDQLDWKKPFAIMYVTHSSLAVPWMCHVSYLRWKNRHMSFAQWFKGYILELTSLIDTVDAYKESGKGILSSGNGRMVSQMGFLWTTMGYATVIMTVSGVSWFCSLALTTPADLTAIYNCSTFFAAVFSVPILKERLSRSTKIAVGLSLAGTFIIAYGDSTGEHTESPIGSSRLLGNLIACVGAIAFGLYEVLMKKWACPSTPEAVRSSLSLTLAASALTGFLTCSTLWIALIVLHFTGVEVFVFPSIYTCLWVVMAVLASSVGNNLLILLVIWTDPVFGSMVNVLNVFFVAIADWMVWGLSPSFATYLGGALILIAFGKLSRESLGPGAH